MTERPPPREPRLPPTPGVRAPVGERSSPAERAAEAARQLRGLAARGLDFAVTHEAGQAVTPFADALRVLSQDDDGQGLPVVLVGLDPDAVSQVIAWLLGQDHHVCKVVVPERVGFAELVLQERGFAVERKDSRQEFDGIEAFLDALRGADLIQDDNPDGWMNPLLLRLAGPHDRRGVRLLIPNGLDALERRPALVSMLADRAALAICAGSRANVLTPGAVDTLVTLLGQIPVLLPIDVSHDPGPVPAWVAALRADGQLPAVSLYRDGRAIQDLLFAQDSQVRLLASQAARRRRLEEVLAMLLQQVDQGAAALANRLRLADDLGGERKGDGRERGDAVTKAIAEDIAALRRDREQSARQALRVDGDAWRAVDEVTSTLTVDDLFKTRRGAVDELGLRPETLQRQQAVLEASAKRFLATDLELIRDGLAATCDQASTALHAITGTAHTLSPPMLDPARMWEALTAIVRPEIRYRAEMPHATILTRITAARRSIMLVSMFAMMIGGAATMLFGSAQAQSLRTMLYAGMLPLLIIGVVWSYMRGGQAESERLGKEVERLRETVTSECRRLMTELQREKGVLLTQLLADAERALCADAEQTLRACEEARRSERERERGAQQVRNRTIEQRLKDVQRSRGEIERMSRETRDLDRLFRDWSRDLTALLRPAT